MKLPQITQDKIANELYEAATRSRDSAHPRDYLGMSEIGNPCSRRIWFSFRGFTPLPVDGRGIMIFRFGDMIEEEIIHHFRLAGYRIEGQQAEFSDLNGLFKGHCDGIVHGVTQKPHILEIKSCNAKKFALFKKNGVMEVYPAYYDQIQCYMGYSGLERGIFVIQCKDNSEIYTERIHFSKTDFTDIKNRAKEIIEANEAPARQFEEDSFNCQWCEHRIRCWRPEEAILIERDRRCGTCRYFQVIQGPEPSCRHQEHAFRLKRMSGCPDWTES